MNKKIAIIGSVLICVLGLIGFFALQKEEPLKPVIIGSTTSLNDSGLLEQLLPEFTEDTGYPTKLVAVGTGQALQLGVDGEVDVLLVHSKAAEEEFVNNGDGLKRHFVMYNDFVLVGPADDPLNLSGAAGSDIKKAFEILASENGKFISRGDDSGTHKKELSIWKSLGMEPIFDQYTSAGTGMAEVLKMADELQGYTLTDRGTYDKNSQQLFLVVVVEGDKSLLNEYGAIAINPDKNDLINGEGAEAFIKWLLSKKIQDEIGAYGVEISGKPLFNPTYEKYE